MRAAQIVIHLPDDEQLPVWLQRFRDLGFLEIDWCEMRSHTDKAQISYAPCEPHPDPYDDWMDFLRGQAGGDG